MDMIKIKLGKDFPMSKDFAKKMESWNAKKPGVKDHGKGRIPGEDHYIKLPELPKPIVAFVNSFVAFSMAYMNQDLLRIS